MAKTSSVEEQTASTLREWKKALGHLLSTAGSDSSVAVVGVGHPLRGDDYVGSFIVKAVMNECRSNCVHFLDAEEGVETVISKIVELRPKHVVFIDACEMNARPGEAALVPVAQTDYPFFTTHGIPLKLLAKQFLPRCQVWVLAVQPEQMEFNDRLSPRVRQSAVTVANFIVDTLKGGSYIE